MSALPLSKVMDLPADYEALASEMELVHTVGVEGQHDCRRWEYALALRAIAAQQKLSGTLPDPYRVLDVGGAGSGFSLMAAQLPGRIACDIVDPKVNTDLEHAAIPLASVDAICCLSTLEHVPESQQGAFLHAAYGVLKPYGLFFLTFDYKGEEGPDTYHFHWMRERIFTPSTRQALADQCKVLGFRPFGAYSPVPARADHVYDYSFASLSLLKFPQERRR